MVGAGSWQSIAAHLVAAGKQKDGAERDQK